MREICSKLAITTQQNHVIDVVLVFFYVNFELISHIDRSGFSIVDFKQVNAG